MNVLSLFDGISCGQLALERAGIQYDNYYASEVDKYAIAVTQYRFPNTIQIGDVQDVKACNLPKIDLLIGGSPCQGFSVAGKRLAFDDPRSKLFFEFVRILREYKPKYFLLENVRMKKEYLDVITQYMGVEPIKINSALVSAQNRVRYYWTNIPNIVQPEDRGIILGDIVEEGDVDRLKSYCIDANYWKGTNLKMYQSKSRRQLVYHLPHGYKKEKIEESEKYPSLHAQSPGHNHLIQVGDRIQTTMGGGHRDPKVACGAWRGRYVIDGKRQDGKMKTAGLTTQRLEVRDDEKTNTLTTVQKDNAVVDLNQLTWRKLTPLECERLQTIPDNYTLVPWQNRTMSNTQRYKMIGNAWTVDVIKHILEAMQ